LPAFEEDPAAFVEVFSDDLGTFAKGLDIEPLSVFLRLAGTVLPASVLAMVKVAMAVPSAVYFISGSLPRYPISRVFCMGLVSLSVEVEMRRETMNQASPASPSRGEGQRGSARRRMVLARFRWFGFPRTRRWNDRPNLRRSDRRLC
jgi:hypothetical protein